MLFMASNLTKRGEVFYFRARIPTHLVTAYGREIVSLSLRTTDLRVAKERAREHAVALDRALRALEQEARPDADFAGTVLHLSDEDIEGLCLRYRAKVLAADEISRIQGMSAADVEAEREIYEGALVSQRDSYARGDLSQVYPAVREFLKGLNLRVPGQSPAFERLARAFQRADIEVNEAVLQRRSGVAVPVPLTSSDTVTIDDVLTCWKGQKARNAKTARSFEQAFEEFKRYCLAPTAKLVKKADAVAFRNALKSKGEHSDTTIEKFIGFLRAAFQCATDDDLLEANPFVGVKVKKDEQAQKEKPRIPFTVEQLKKLFSGPVYQAGFTPRKGLGASCYWLPLLSLYSGARLEELAQLRVSDICKDPELGWYFKIDRNTKTASSRRNLPVHPALIELGFLTYVEGRKKGPLFPTLKADKYGKIGTTFSTWFGRYLDSLEIRDERIVFHSFRHGFSQQCKSKGAAISPEVREAMLGHLSVSSIAATYGEARYPLEPQVAAMRLVEFPGLDLSHLVPRGR